jgi:hypothetical protein
MHGMYVEIEFSLLTTPILYIRRDLGKPRPERWRLLARGENELLKAEGE